MNKMWTLYLLCWGMAILDLRCTAFDDSQDNLRINTKNNGKIDPYSFEVYPTKKENPKSYSEDADMDMFFQDSKDFDFEDDGFFSEDTFNKDSFSKSVAESRKRYMHDVSNIDKLFENSLKSDVRDLLKEDDTTKTTHDDASSKNINTTERTGVLEDDNERNVQQTTQTNMRNLEANELKIENTRTNSFNSENPQIANIPLFSDINRAAGSNPVAKLVSLTDVDTKNVIENGLDRSRKGVSHDSHPNEGLSDTDKREIGNGDFDGLNVVTEISVLETINGETVQRKPSSEELRLVEDSILMTERQTTDKESKLESPVTVNYYDADKNIQEGSDVSKTEKPVLYADKTQIDVLDLSTILKVDPEFSDDGMDKMLSDDSDDVRDMDIIFNNEHENEHFKRQQISNNIMENITNINETPWRQESNFDNNGSKTLLSEGEKVQDPRDYRKIYHTMHKNLSNVSDVKITFSETEGDFLDDDNEYVFNITEKPNEAQENNVITTIETTKMPETPESINTVQNSEIKEKAEISMKPIIRIIPEILFKNDDIIDDETDMENINFPAPDTEDLTEIKFKTEETKVTTNPHDQINKNISDILTKLDKDSVELVQGTEILKKLVDQDPIISTTVIVPRTDISTDSTVLIPINNSSLNLDNLEQGQDNIFGDSEVTNNFNISLNNEEASSVTSNIDFVLGELEKINDKVKNVITPTESVEPYNDIITTDETPSVVNRITDELVYLEEPFTGQLEDSDAVTTNPLYVSSSTNKTSEKMDSIDRTVALIKQILHTSEIDLGVADSHDYVLQKPTSITNNTEKAYMNSDSSSLPMTNFHVFETTSTDSLSAKAAFTIPLDTSTVQIDITERVFETTQDFKNFKETTTIFNAEETGTAFNSAENPKIQDGSYIYSTESVLISTGWVEKSDKDLNDLIITDNVLDYQVEIMSTESVESDQNVLTLATVTKVPTSPPNISKNVSIYNLTAFTDQIGLKESNKVLNTSSLIKPVEPSQDISSSEVESLYNAQIEEHELMIENDETFDGTIDSLEIENKSERYENPTHKNTKKEVDDVYSNNIKVNSVNTVSIDDFKKIVVPYFPGVSCKRIAWLSAQTEAYELLKENNKDFVGKVSKLESRPGWNIILNKNYTGLNSYATDKQDNTTIVPILRGVILNNTLEFSVKVTIKDKLFYVPSYAYIREYLDLYSGPYLRSTINITWKINDNLNNSLEINVRETEYIYIIEELSVKLQIGDEFLKRWNQEIFMSNTSDLTMGKNLTLVMDNGLRITFSNVDFLKKKYDSKLEYVVIDQRLGSFEVACICLGVIAVLGVGFYIVIDKTKRKITLREKEELAQGTKC